MKLIPVSLALFYKYSNEVLNVWTQVREDDGIYQGMLEFPGGGIEPGEEPLIAAVREVEEEVGISIDPIHGKLMGTYPIELAGRTILLYVFLFPKSVKLDGKGHWLQIRSPELSAPYKGKIPAPNHKIIDDLFLALKG